MEHHETYASHLVHHLTVTETTSCCRWKAQWLFHQFSAAREAALGSEDTELEGGRSEFTKLRELLGTSNFLVIKLGLEGNGDKECSPCYSLALWLHFVQSWFYLTALSHFSSLLYIFIKIGHIFFFFVLLFKILSSFGEKTLCKYEIEWYDYLILRQSYSKNIILW